MEDCPNCDGQIKIIAAIVESAVIERIRTYLGLEVRRKRRRAALVMFRQ